jgi:hypothetical protein
MEQVQRHLCSGLHQHLVNLKPGPWHRIRYHLFKNIKAFVLLLYMMCHPPSNTACRGRCTRRHFGTRPGQRPCAVLASVATLEPPPTLDTRHAALERAVAVSSAMRPLPRRIRQSASWSTARLSSSENAVGGALSASRGSRRLPGPLPLRSSTLVKQPLLPTCAHLRAYPRGRPRTMSTSVGQFGAARGC